MAKKKKYIVTHSNYTVKKKHKTIGGDRTIYERDFAVTTNNGSWESNGIPYGTSTFKMVKHNRLEGTKKHNYGGWLTQTACPDENNSEIWSLKCLGDTNISKEGKISLNPNSSSLLDFAYYGSCTELIKSTINKIIENFPGELYVTDAPLSFVNENRKLEEIGAKNNKKLVVIENPFEINLINSYDGKEGNIIRFFSDSFLEYETLNENGEYINGVSQWVVRQNSNISFECLKDGDFLYTINLGNCGKNKRNLTIYAYYFSNKIFYFTEKNNSGLKIRPKKEIIESFFNGLDDLSAIMLNRSSKPIYTMTLEYPNETDYGVALTKENLTWPLKNGWNLDIVSANFVNYLNKLLDLSNYYDDKNTNNLWRMMTHDAIKNMDSNLTKNGEDNDDYILGLGRIEGLMMSYGRQFDEIKRLIDGIKSNNVLSYDNNNNIPSYFLSDKLEMLGWDVSNATLTLDEKQKERVIYPGFEKEYSPVDANIEFMRRLGLNSKKMLSKKGTKNSIEMVMGLFGLKSYDYTRNLSKINSLNEDIPYDYRISEFVNVVTDTTLYNADETTPIEKYNQWKNNYDTPSLESDEPEDYLQGLPVRMVEFKNNEGYKKYIIPWFDKFQMLDGKPYFQMFGGWGKMPSKNVKNPITNENSILSSNTQTSSFIYEESTKYIKVVRNLKDLTNISASLVNDGDIFYVVDINDFNDTYQNPKTGHESEHITLNGGNGTKKASHYFRISNKNNRYKVGFFDSLAESEDFFKWTKDGKKEITLDEVIDDYLNDQDSGIGYSLKLMRSSNTATATTVEATITTPEKLYKFICYKNNNQDLILSNYPVYITSNGEEKATGVTNEMGEVSLYCKPNDYFNFVIDENEIVKIQLTNEMLQPNVDIYLNIAFERETCSFLFYQNEENNPLINKKVLIKNGATTIDSGTTSENGYVDLRCKIGDNIVIELDGNIFKTIEIDNDLYKPYQTIRINVPSEGDIENTSTESTTKPSATTTKPSTGTTTKPSATTTTKEIVYTEESGWINIPEEDIENGTNYGFSVIYLESIVDEYKGNNPHVGWGKYDNGEEYINYFRNLFKFSIENNNFNDYAYQCEDGLKDGILNTGFKIDSLIKDNVKIWYFTDTLSNNQPLDVNNRTYNKTTGNSIINGELFKNSSVLYTNNDIAPQGNNLVGYENEDKFFESNLESFNFEDGDSFDEAAANSILNDKRLILEFNKDLDNEEFKNYLNYSILPFLKQLIPSTTILEIKFDEFVDVVKEVKYLVNGRTTAELNENDILIVKTTQGLTVGKFEVNSTIANYGSFNIKIRPYETTPVIERLTSGGNKEKEIIVTKHDNSYFKGKIVICKKKNIHEK